MEEEQDMFDPEFYLSQYQVKNVMDLSMKTLCGMYRDVVSWGGSMGSGPVQEDRGGGGWTQWDQNQYPEEIFRWGKW